MASSPDQIVYAHLAPGTGAFLFIAGYLCVILAVAVWSRRLARRVTGEQMLRSTRRFNWVISAAQAFVPAWLAAGVFVLGWYRAVEWILGPAARWPVELP